MNGLSLGASLLALLILVASVSANGAPWHRFLNGKLNSKYWNHKSRESTLEECVSSCEALGGPCKSIDYRAHGKCCLTNVTKEQVPADDWEVGTSSVHLEKAPSDVVGAFFCCVLRTTCLALTTTSLLTSIYPSIDSSTWRFCLSTVR